MKKVILSIIIIISIFMIAGCNSKKKEMDNIKDNNSNEVIKEMKVIINDKEYLIILEDNETVKTFVNMLP